MDSCGQKMGTREEKITEAILERLPGPAHTGRPRADMRQIIRGIIFRMRTGCQWRALPEEYGPWKTVHNWQSKLIRAGLFDELFRDFLSKADAEGRVNHEAYFMDASIVKAPCGGDGTGPSPVHRGRLGCKRSILTDGNGKPIAIVTSKANRHDARLFLKTLNAAAIPLRRTSLKMDKGYSGALIFEAAAKRGLLAVVPRKKGQKRTGLDADGGGRWKVERTFAWMNKWKALSVRTERKRETYEGILFLWAAMVWG